MITKPFLRLRKRSAFLSLVSILLFAVGARAEESGDYTYWVVNGTSVTISKYNGTDTVVEIPSEIAGLPVKTIGYNAFGGVTSLVEVKIPDSVELIRGDAFSSCSGLRMVELGTGVTQIQYGAFSSNYLLRVLFKGNAPTLEGYAFGDASKRGFSLFYEAGATGFNSPEWEGYPCAQWDAASFQPWVYEVVNDEVVLYDYAGLAHDLTTPATIEGKPVTSIGQGAFNSHSGLTGTFTIGSSVTQVSWNSFSNCDGLSEIVIPASVTNMGGGFALYCAQLTAISVNPANPNYQSVDGVLFQLGQTELLTCPAGLSGLYSVPEGVTRVLGGAFDGCNALTGLHLSSTVADFQAVPLLGSNGGVSLMQTITVDASNPNYSASDGMLLSKDGKTLVACPPGKTGNLVIPEGVTSVAYSAFYNCIGFDGALTLPSTLQIIESQAFQDCSGLTGGLVIPEGVTSIGSYAFSDCSGLTGGLVIPEGVTSVAYFAFYNCSRLDGTLTLPSTLQIIESYAFDRCSGLTGALVIPEGVTSIGSYAFNDCSGLTSITIGSGVGAIGDRAFFSWSSQLSRIEFLGDAPTLGTDVFPSSGDFTVYYRTGAEGFDAAGWQEYRLLAIASEQELEWTEDGNAATITAYSGSGGDIVLPSTLNGKAIVAIGAGVFQHKTSITSIELPASVTSIGADAFAGCTALASVELSVALTSIGERAFMGSGLSGEVVIPATVTAIGSRAFADCPSLGSVLFQGNEPASFGTEVFANTAADFMVFCRSEASGFAASPWQGYTLYRWAPASDFQYYDNGSGIVISAYNGSAETLVFPAEIGGQPVVSISYNGWSSNDTIVEVVIPASVSSVDNYSLRVYNSLESIRVSSGNLTFRSVDGVLFSKAMDEIVACPRGKTGEFTIPSSVTAIGPNAFTGCSSLTGLLVIPEGITAIGPNAFNNCSGLTGDLVIPDSVISIGVSAFQNCSGLTAVTIGRGVDSIGGAAFAYCGSLERAYFLGDASVFGGGLFLYAADDFRVYYTSGANGFSSPVWEGYPAYAILSEQELEWTEEGNTATITAYSGSGGNVVIPSALNGKAVVAIGAGVFQHKTSITSIELPANVTSIGADAFAGCTALASVELPASITSIGERAFMGSGLSGEVVIPATVTSIGSQAFADCTALESVLFDGNEPASFGTEVFANTAAEFAVFCRSDASGFAASPWKGYTLLRWAPKSDFEYNDEDWAGGITITYYNGSAETLVFPAEIDGLPVKSIDWYGGSSNYPPVRQVYIPSTVSHLNNSGFSYYNLLEGFHVASGNRDLVSVEGVVYSKDMTIVYACPKAWTGPFTIPSTVTNIYSYAFRGCSGLSGHLVIPDGVTQISTYAFEGCSGLSSITIGSGVSNIGQYAFKGCRGLDWIAFNGNTAPYIGYNVFYGLGSSFVIVHQSGASGFTSPTWQGYPTAVMARPDELQWTETDTQVTITGYTGAGGALAIPSQINGKAVTQIGSMAFQNRPDITSIVLPSTLTVIGPDAFSGCTGISGKLVLPDGLLTINGRAFQGCTGLTGDVVIPGTVTAIRNRAFYGCSGIAGVTFLGDAPSVAFGTDVFTGTAAGFSLSCTAIATGFTTPLWNGYSMLRWAPEADFVCKTNWDRLWAITDYTGSAEYLVIPGVIGGKAVERIDGSAFDQCNSLVTVRLPSSLLECRGNAFGNCPSLTGFEVAAGNPVFKAVDGLVLDTAGETLVLYPTGRPGVAVIPEGIKKLGDYVFYGSEGFTGFSFPSTLLEIGLYALGGLQNVYEIILPDSVTTIGQSAFTGSPSSLASVTVGTGLTSLDSMAFGWSTNLAWVRFKGNAPALTGWGSYFQGLRSGFTVYYDAGTTGYDSPDWVSQGVPVAQWNPANDPDWIVQADGAGVKVLGYTMPAQNLVIPNTINGKTVVSIATSAFRNSTQFSGTLTIGSGVTTVEEGAFAGTSNVTAILVDAANPSFASQNGLLYNKTLSTLIACPGGKEGVLSIPSGTVEIGSGALDYCGELTSVHLPASLQVFNAGRMYSCAKLTAFTVDAGNPYFNAVDGVLFSKDALTLVRCPTGKAGAVVIPSEVTSIAPHAFSQCTLLTGGLSLPSGLTTIGDSAFYYCTGLTGELVLPAGLTGIADYAFYVCSGFTGDLVIPDGVTSIGDYAFAWTGNSGGGFSGTLTLPSSLLSIGQYAFAGAKFTGNLVLPSGVTTIGEYAFFGCSGFSGSLVIPEGVTVIELRTFSGCSGITSLSLPDGLTSIGESAFDRCSGLTSLILPASLDSIGTYAFSYCDELESVTFLGNAPTMGEDVFGWSPPSGLKVYYMAGASGFTTPTWYDLACQEWALPELFSFGDFECRLVDGSTITIIGYSGDGGDVLIPDAIYGKPVTAIGARAFEMKLNSDNPGSLTLPRGLVSIGVSAFEFCSGMTGALVLPENLVSIGERAFVGCRITGEITIPHAVATIGSGAFYSCSGLTAINVAASNGQYSSLDGALYNENQTQLILVPAAKSGSFSIPSSVTAIGDYAMAYCNQLTGSLMLPANLVSIGDMAFTGCIGFTGEVVIPASVTAVGDGAFQSVNLSGISVHDGNPNYSSVDGMLLSKDGTLLIQCPMGKTGALTIPGTVTEIGDRAFVGCSGLTGQLVIPAGVQIIGNSAFAGCSGFTGQLVVENTVISIDSMAFMNCQGITSALFKGNAPATGEELFEGTAEGFKIYHLSGATGFTTPTWGGWPYYPCEVWVSNKAPRFRIIGNKTVRAGQPITFEVIADDEDAGDVLQYSATNP